MKLYFLFFHFFFTVMEFMTCVSFGHSCFHVVSTCRYDCSCVSSYVYTMIQCIHIIVMSLLCYCYIIHVSLMGYIQTCLNSFLNSFISTVHSNIFVVHTQLSILCYICLSFIKGCIIYLIKLQSICVKAFESSFTFVKKKT